MNDKIIVYAIPFFLLMIALEWWVGKIKNNTHYQINDTIGNLFSGISEQAFSIFSKALLLTIADYLQQHYALFKIPTTWWSITILFLLFDFLFYWAHRIGHESNLFWGSHIVHHQSQQYNLSVALRQPWLLPIMTFFLFLPIPLLGFDALSFAIVAAFSTLYQFWIHTQQIGKLGFLEYILNTPSHHRVHHGSNPQYIDKNYGAVLIIWDRLFNTFQPEEETVNYGITTPFESQNAVWANTYYLQDIWNNLQKLPTWQQKLRYIFISPMQLKNNFPQLYANTASTQPTTPKTVPTALSLYAAIQCIIVIIGLSALLYYIDELNIVQKAAAVVTIIISSLTVGAVLDQKTWARVAETTRMTLLIVAMLIIFQHHFLFTPILFLSILLSIASIIWMNYHRQLFSLN
ncbi:MAG: sterol desaturase family protein [Chitinophagales bacterium]|nr:sterol desaturase family protein [Chitinophagales bacterium]